MLVIDMAVTLLFGGPADGVVLAGGHSTLPGARVGFLMFTGVISTIISRAGLEETYVKSQGRLKTLSQREHFWLMSMGGSCFLRRAMERRTSSLAASSPDSRSMTRLAAAGLAAGLPAEVA